ncbi:MAG: hypothetical protein PHW47_03555 [Lachnospira sp.]|nr:hypothetical protein [Lachnospira sp.]
MIDEHEIMPFNFFKYGGIYSGGHEGMRYMIRRAGEKPDFILKAMVWRGPYASTAVKEEDITQQEFEYSEDGRSLAIEWIANQYDSRVDEWQQAPEILDIEPIVHE